MRIVDIVNHRFQFQRRVQHHHSVVEFISNKHSSTCLDPMVVLAVLDGQVTWIIQLMKIMALRVSERPFYLFLVGDNADSVFGVGDAVRDQ